MAKRQERTLPRGVGEGLNWQAKLGLLKLAMEDPDEFARQVGIRQDEAEDRKCTRLFKDLEHIRLSGGRDRPPRDDRPFQILRHYAGYDLFASKFIKKYILKQHEVDVRWVVNVHVVNFPLLAVRADLNHGFELLTGLVGPRMLHDLMRFALAAEQWPGPVEASTARQVLELGRKSYNSDADSLRKKYELLIDPGPAWDWILQEKGGVVLHPVLTGGSFYYPIVPTEMQIVDRTFRLKRWSLLT